MSVANHEAVQIDQAFDLDGVLAACARIAPTWPLDQQIAVNPYWHFRDLHISEASARISALSGAKFHVPPRYYAEAAEPAVEAHHLRAAGDWLEVPTSGLTSKVADASITRFVGWRAFSDFADEYFSDRFSPWRELIVDNISAVCADFYGNTQRPRDGSGEGGLYAFWLAHIGDELGAGFHNRIKTLSRRFETLPADPLELIGRALDGLGLPGELHEAYVFALLMDINGWASWVAYERWQQGLRNETRAVDTMLELVAVRLGWELALWEDVQARTDLIGKQCIKRWQSQLETLPQMLDAQRLYQTDLWLWQTAAEHAFQEAIVKRMETNRAAARKAPALQAVFCIDVRSEIIRRHLEAQSDAIETLGFAGFFGLPIDYELAGGVPRKPLLPGLLAPTLTASEVAGDAVVEAAGQRASKQAVSDTPASSFGLVESTGLLYAAKLIRDAFFPGAAPAEPSIKLAGEAIELTSDGLPVDPETCAELAHGILTALGLVDNFAKVVLLVGHGSASTNNPHATSLNCGACCGASGAANARLLAGLLNRTVVRSKLAGRGIHIPVMTSFVPAMHNTTTDEILPLAENVLDKEAADWLRDASHATRRERAPKLGIKAGTETSLLTRFQLRSRDWSQVRPEWGLANNAAFVVAPRSLIRGADLGGRSFLHEYNEAVDTDNSVLETIITAPMVVTHWINMQYNASVTDNRKFGSGNKVLHNVVGGNLGVLEGQRGDLRIGLSMQSVNDGEDWMHTPLRLSVFVNASPDRILKIYRDHEVVRELVDNEWLYLFHLSDELKHSRLYEGAWLPHA